MIRKIIFEEDVCYHIYNRGTDKRKIFMDKGDLYYFFDALIISNKVAPVEDRWDSRKKNKNIAKEESKLVSIIAYCLLPNHFHLILKQEVEGGISKFMQKVSNSYTKYFNRKYERSGVLFQGKFKASAMAFEDSLERTSAYVNLNYKHHKIDPKKSLVKTSLFEFLGEEKEEKICNQNEIKNIIAQAKGLDKYKIILKEESRYFIEEHGYNSKDINFKELES